MRLPASLITMVTCKKNKHNGTGANRWVNVFHIIVLCTGEKRFGECHGPGLFMLKGTFDFTKYDGKMNKHSVRLSTA